MAASGLCFTSASAETPIKVGLQAVLTGPNSVDGVNSQIAINLAVQTWNKAGGIKGRPIEIIALDDQAKPDLAVPVINRLLGEDDIVGILSATLSEPTKAAAPFAQDAGVPYISGWASSPDVTHAGDFIFRIGLLAPIEGKAGAAVISKIMQKKKVALVTVKSDLGKEVKRGFREVSDKLGLEVVGDLEFAVGDRQFGPMIANLKTLGAEVVFLTGYYFHGAIVPQMRAAGLDIPVVGMTSFSAQQFLDIAGPSANGMLVLNVIDWSNPSPELKDFLAAFNAKAGYAPTASAAHAYTGADVLFKAIEKAGTDHKAVRDALASMQFSTIVGPLSFNSLHETKRVVYVSEVKDGKYTTKAIIDDPVLLAPPEK
jgi:branched-chain amino acid transport system substrate-binding protein